MTLTRLKAEKAPRTDGKHSSADVHTKNGKEKEAKGKILKYVARSYLELQEEFLQMLLKNIEEEGILENHSDDSKLFLFE